MADNLPAPETSWYISLIQGTTAIPTAIAKLIETVGEQIGLFLEPAHIRRKGKAEADVTVAKAKAEAGIAVVQVQNKLAIRDFLDRADERVSRRETKRQKNIEAITAQAVKELPESVSEKPVDEDWVTQFFNHCQDVSNEQMQSLWARLLAGEAANPGSFSLRTLALVKVMSKEEANLFTRFCSMVWQTPEGLVPIVPWEGKISSIVGLQLDSMDFVHLNSLGLIRFETFVSHSIEVTSDPRFVCSYHGRQHILARQDMQGFSIGNFLLTEVGKELAAIAGSTPNEEYLSWVISDLREKGWEVVEVSLEEDPGEAPKQPEHEATEARGAGEKGDG